MPRPQTRETTHIIVSSLVEQTVASVDLTKVSCLIVLVHPLHWRQALSKKWQAVQWTKMARVVMVKMVIASIYLDTVIMLWGILRRKNWTCTHMHGHWLLVILRCFDVKTKHAHRCTVADCSLFWRVIWLWRRKILRIMMSHQVIATSYPDTFWQKKDVTLRIYGVITTYILTEIWCHMK